MKITVSETIKAAIKHHESYISWCERNIKSVENTILRYRTQDLSTTNPKYLVTDELYALTIKQLEKYKTLIEEHTAHIANMQVLLEIVNQTKEASPE